MIHVLIPGRNRPDLLRVALGSLHRQGQANFSVTVIDDASDNVEPQVNEVQRFSDWLPRKGGVGRGAVFIQRQARGGELASIMTGMKSLIDRGAKDTDIVCHLCADDWLYDKALAHVRLYYEAMPEIWITWGQYRRSDQLIGHCAPVNPTLVRNNAWRDGPWVTSHLRAYRVGLWRRVPEEQFIDPTTGHPWFNATDLAMMFPMLELAGLPHSGFISKVLYGYRVYDGNVPPAEYADCCARVRQMPRLARIHAL